MRNNIKLKDLLDEITFPKKELVKTVTLPKYPDYFAHISKAITKYEITLGSYRGQTNYLINTTKEAKSLPAAEKIAKEWIKSYAKNPK